RIRSAERTRALCHAAPEFFPAPEAGAWAVIAGRQCGMEERVRHFRRIRPFRNMAMPTVNDDFNRTVTRLDLDPELSGVFTPGAVAALRFDDAELMRFNGCVARVAPGMPAPQKRGLPPSSPAHAPAFRGACAFRRRRLARHAIAAGHAMRRKRDLPQLIAAGAEGGGRAGQVVAPHAPEAFVVARIVGREFRPC